MGIDTLTADKFMSEVERVQTELIDSGESRVSLDDIGDRKVSKKIIKQALDDLDVAGKEMDFDGETNEFVVTVKVAALADEDDADSVDSVDSEDSDDSADDDEVESDPGPEADDDRSDIPF